MAADAIASTSWSSSRKWRLLNWATQDATDKVNEVSMDGPKREEKSRRGGVWVL